MRKRLFGFFVISLACFLPVGVGDLDLFPAGTALAWFAIEDPPALWPENGHFYLIVNQAKSWPEARSLAEEMVFMGVRGHLATITSEDENIFVTTQLGDSARASLGGWQLPGSPEPAGGWEWITGEPWSYENWSGGEPNNTDSPTGQSEERLQYDFDGTHWNDISADPEMVWPRFIVEWDVPQAEDSDGDGIPDSEDDCPNSDPSTTIIIDGCDTRVPNTLFPSGCALSDLIAACAQGANNHGQFVRCVSNLTNDLKKAGSINDRQKGVIQRCAAHADIR